jgi:hypothetical protein
MNMRSETDSILEGALARLQIGWSQVHMAELPNGKDTDSCDPKAVSWCSLGALSAAADSLGVDVTRKAGRRLFHQACYRVAFNMPTPEGPAADLDYLKGIEGAISDWNDDDHTSAEDVILAFKNALCA